MNDDTMISNQDSLVQHPRKSIFWFTFVLTMARMGPHLIAEWPRNMPLLAAVTIRISACRRMWRQQNLCLLWYLFLVHVFLWLPSLEALQSSSSTPPPPRHQSTRLHEQERRGIHSSQSSIDNADCTTRKLENRDQESGLVSSTTISRRSCLVSVCWGVASSAIITSVSSPFTATNNLSALAFEGGIGGLGKTKPETGVQFWNQDLYDMSSSENKPMMQNSAGVVAAELNVNNKPVLVSFTAPWPLLPTTTGLEARDLQLPESAFVQVVTGGSQGKKNNVKNIDLPTTKTQAREIWLNSVLGPQGKFGAYGTPVEVKLKAVDDTSNNLTSDKQVVVYRVSFTAYTPGLRETDRQAFVAFHRVATDAIALVLLVVGTTQIRFPQQQDQLWKIISSFEVVPAPTTRTRSPS